MAREQDRYQLLTRRLFLLAGLQGLAVTTLAARIWQLQVLEGDHYRKLAEDNRISSRLLAPSRGRILDRAGQPLAVNQQIFRAVLDADQDLELEELLVRLALPLRLDDVQLHSIRQQWRQRRRQQAILLRDNIPWENVAWLELHAYELPGVRIEEGQSRHYPFGPGMAAVLGYVGPPAEAELDGDPLLRLPGFLIGKGGIERQYESRLRGRAGNRQLEVNALGRVVRELSINPGQPGQDLTLTIDGTLQQAAQQRLAHERSGAAVILDIANGAIYALASHPAYDPNLFTFGIPHKIWDALRDDETAPLLNKVVSGQYAPGSTFKMVTALAALAAGVVTPEQRVFCPGHYELGKHRFHCWKHSGHGSVNLAQAIAQSCDTYFYDISRRAGVDRIAAMARRLGLGERTGVDLPGERAGLVPDMSWKRARFNQSWQQGETLIAAIGQGYMLATPLQLAVMQARLVSGRAVVPRLWLATSAPPADLISLGLSPAHLTAVQQGMVDAVNAGAGTAHAARITDMARQMGGKTGTAQVRRISMAERSSGIIPNEERPWRLRDHALFTGYAPVAAPRLAIAVVIEHGGSGSKVAAPIARDLLLLAQRQLL